MKIPRIAILLAIGTYFVLVAAFITVALEYVYDQIYPQPTKISYIVQYVPIAHDMTNPEFAQDVAANRLKLCPHKQVMVGLKKKKKKVK